MNPSSYPIRDFQWSQRDIRWSWKKLGESTLSVHSFGCAALCLTYVIDRYRKDNGQPFYYPNYLIDRFMFTGDGRVYWNNPERFTDGRVKHTNDDRKAHYVLIEVYWGQLRHWVVRLGRDTDNLCYNPWTGKIETFKRSYWTPTGRRIYYAKV